MSKLSLNTVVTARSISRLSVASVRIFCAACVVALVVGGAIPFVCRANPLPCDRRDDGEDALEAGRER